MLTMVLFDAHGPDHGLSVSLDGGDVTVTDWCQGDGDPDEGDYTPTHLHRATMDLATCLKYAAKSGRAPFDSQRDRVIQGALEYLSYWGGEEELLDDDATPCQHFMGACLVCEPWRVGDSVVVSFDDRVSYPVRGRVSKLHADGLRRRMVVTAEDGGEHSLMSRDGGETWHAKRRRAWPHNCEYPMRDRETR